LACLTILLGTGIAQEKNKSPDEQVKELIAKYRALPEKDQIGPKGASLIKQLKAVPGKLAQQSREAIARLEVAHNLRQIALAIPNYEGKDAKPPSVDPKWFSQLLPYIEPGLARPRWEYKVVSEADILKLGKDDLAAGLNKLGEDGWELVAFEKTRFILKRQNSSAKMFPGSAEQITPADRPRE
jgi:hypothetical protein